VRRATVAVLLLLSPVFVLAGRLPGISGVFDRLRRLPAEAALDYSRQPGGFAPLSAAFFSRLYGDVLPLSANQESGRGRTLGDDPRSGGEARHGEVSDSFSDAVEIHRVPFESSGDTAAATREPGEPDGCSRVGGTVWYRYAANSDARLIASTFGSGYPTSLGIFRGTSLRSLEPVGCSTEARGNSFVAFPAERGATYYFQVAGLVGGAMRFGVDPIGPATLASTGPTDSEPRNNEEPSISADGRYVVFTSFQAMTARAEENCPEAGKASAPAHERGTQSSNCTQVFVRDLAAGTTRLVSIAPGGAGGNANSDQGVVSADGRYVAFRSLADNLVPGDTNGISDIFLRDLQRDTTERISVTQDGRQAEPRVLAQLDAAPPPVSPTNWASNVTPTISADGRVIAWVTQSPNLVGGTLSCGAQSGCGTVVVVDRARRTLKDVCVHRTGPSQVARCMLGSISSSGRFVVFQSESADLVADHDGTLTDVFIRDLQAQRTDIVSVTTDGEQGNEQSRVWNASIYGGSRHVSADGRWVVFSSSATNFTAGDDQGSVDTFLRDRVAGTTIRVNPAATSGATTPHEMAISDDGRIVVFGGEGQYASGDANTISDVYVRNIATWALLRVTVDENGNDTGGRQPTLSPDGTAIAYASFGDASGASGEGESLEPVSRQDVFVRELPASFV